MSDSHASERGRPSAEDSGRADGSDWLATSLSDLARDLEREAVPADTLVRMVRAAVDMVPGADEGSITLVVERSKVTSQAPSGDLARRLDVLQDETRQGPCLDAVYDHQTVRVTDMGTETRWPEFAKRAFAAGAGSMLSLQLYVDGNDLGALNLSARRAGAFDDRSEHVGLLVAAHAAVAFAGVHRRDQLQLAMASRDIIGQARGILMERYKITGDDALMRLVRRSQGVNRKLRDVASDLVHSGDWLDHALPPNVR